MRLLHETTKEVGLVREMFDNFGDRVVRYVDEYLLVLDGVA